MDYQEVDSTAADLAARYERQKGWKWALPKPFRFPLAWTILAACIGISIQSIKAKQLTLLAFFTSNFITWIYSFTAFPDRTIYHNAFEIVTGVLAYWYYYALVGGILVLIWTLIRYLMQIKIEVKPKPVWSPPQKTSVKPLPLTDAGIDPTA